MILFITCQKHYILLRHITKKKQWVAKHTTEQWLKAAVLQTVKTGKKGCVTPFYRIPRNKDQKRCWLTFLCHKTLPNVEYMYVWMHACMDGWMDGCLYVCGEYFVTGKYIIYHKTVFHFPLLLQNLQHSL